MVAARSRRLRATSEAELVELIAGVYDAAIRPELWQPWLERLCCAVRAQTATLLLGFNPGGGDAAYLAVGVKDELRGWFLRDPRRGPSLVGGLALAPGEIANLSEAAPRERFLKSRFYREWMRPQGLRHIAAGLIDWTPERMAGIGVMRRRGAPPFGEAEIDLLRRLAPHMQRVIRVQDVRELGEIEREAGERIGDALRIGAILVHGSGRVLVANRRAAALLDARDGPRLHEGRLVARTPAETHALRELITGAARPKVAARSRAGGALVLSRSKGPALVVLVSPLRVGSAAPVSTERTVALVILRAPEDVPVPSEADLRSLYGLTPAEARVACHLAVGRTADEIANALGVRLSTVRTHVQNLLGKTGVRRQSELVRLLVSGPWL